MMGYLISLNDMSCRQFIFSLNMHIWDIYFVHLTFPALQIHAFSRLSYNLYIFLSFIAKIFADSSTEKSVIPIDTKLMGHITFKSGWYANLSHIH